MRINVKEVIARAESIGFNVAIHKPGDGVIRYKVYSSSLGDKMFHSVPSHDSKVALGPRELKAMVDGLVLAKWGHR